jgi:hypothetical protein
MSVIKGEWAAIQEDPVFMRRVNGRLTVFWMTGWINSVAYVASLSLWALVSGHGPGSQAGRVEVEQARQKETAPEEVVDHIVDKTELERSSARW